MIDLTDLLWLRPPADAQRALLLLEEYRAKLNHTEDRQLRHSIQRVIDIFQSNLFQALIGNTPALTQKPLQRLTCLDVVPQNTLKFLLEL